ncbi:MAG: tRNA (adenosine(37)-N6)-dimethylallyltransferase MiaA [Candidatus Daviesbacteria bacterium]|nr:tRNA (adenosine(37)-N6)-dimethylallyltransferase MiaA [Candidatus Daviesbacteria bacterium]
MKTLVIIGPTSTGKTDLALQLASKFQGELVSVDSRQVYKGLDIGTGKLPGQEVKVEKAKGFWEMAGVKAWMYDVADPNRQYTVFDYVREANQAMDNIIHRNKLPILTAGTGLYLKAFLEGLPNMVVPMDSKLREKLEKLSLDKLQKKLQKASSQKWEKMNNSDRQNPRRLIRAIEIGSEADINIATGGLMSKVDILKIGLIAPREILYQRIDQRVINRIEQGMIKEAEKLYKAGLSLQRMRQLGLEYGMLADYLEGKIQKEELIKSLQGKIHGYARRQITWFKREKEISWFDIMDEDYLSKVENFVAKWYHQSDDTKS